MIAVCLYMGSEESRLTVEKLVPVEEEAVCFGTKDVEVDEPDFSEVTANVYVKYVWARVFE